MKRESNTQKAIITYLLGVLPVKCIVVKIPNELGHGNTEGGVTSGFRKGASDLVIALPTQYSPSTIWLECKTTKLTVNKSVVGPSRYKVTATKQRPDQLQFEADLRAIGHTYWLVPSIDALEPLVADWLAANGLTSRLVPNYRASVPRENVRP